MIGEVSFQQSAFNHSHKANGVHHFNGTVMVTSFPTADDVISYSKKLFIDLNHPAAATAITKHYLILTGRYNAPRKEKAAIETAMRSVISLLVTNPPKPL
ncbi:hypothetical protein C3408_22565 [Candidatus Pantoea alvi]|nr:hypothetical protein C3408_22565 [Pantoea alvi]